MQGILKHADLAQVTILRKIRGNSQESFLRLRVKFWRNSQEFLEILLFNSPEIRKLGDQELRISQEFPEK